MGKEGEKRTLAKERSREQKSLSFSCSLFVNSGKGDVKMCNFVGKEPREEKETKETNVLVTFRVTGSKDLTKSTKGGDLYFGSNIEGYSLSW